MLARRNAASISSSEKPEIIPVGIADVPERAEPVLLAALRKASRHFRHKVSRTTFNLSFGETAVLPAGVGRGNFSCEPLERDRQLTRLSRFAE